MINRPLLQFKIKNINSSFIHETGNLTSKSKRFQDLVKQKNLKVQTHFDFKNFEKQLLSNKHNSPVKPLDSPKVRHKHHKYATHVNKLKSQDMEKFGNEYISMVNESSKHLHKVTTKRLSMIRPFPPLIAAQRFESRNRINKDIVKTRIPQRKNISSSMIRK